MPSQAQHCCEVGKQWLKGGGERGYGQDPGCSFRVLRNASRHSYKLENKLVSFARACSTARATNMSSSAASPCREASTSAAAKPSALRPCAQCADAGARAASPCPAHRYAASQSCSSAAVACAPWHALLVAQTLS